MYHLRMATRAARALLVLPLLLSAPALFGSQSSAGGIAPIPSPTGPGSAQPQLTVSSDRVVARRPPELG